MIQIDIVICITNCNKEGRVRVVVFMGSSIRNFRQSQKTEQEEFAFEVGISQAALSQYENNKRPVPIDFVINITKHYKNVKLLSIWVAKLFEIVHQELITV
ncbi:MAG: helix-turn-helix domain-containing protein [Candidatus Odinarchaeota archaeon]